MEKPEIYFESYGCTANQNSTEIMKGFVKNAGINITLNEDYADIFVINSCIVKEPTEEKIRTRVSELLVKGKKVILAGCMPRLRKDKLINLENSKNLYLLDSSQIKNLTNLIQDIYYNNYHINKYLIPRKEVKAGLPKISSEKIIGITQISEGCLGECTYCSVKLAKGELFSYPLEDILTSVKDDINSGCKEIWITSQDNANYGNDTKEYNLPKLLNEILNIDGNFYVRLGMMNPENVLQILPELIEIYKHPKMFKFLHLPIQSGSNRILKLMNRKYNKEEIFYIINKFRKEIPQITIATDIIVGFPEEKDNDWHETIEVIKEIKPEILNRSNYCLREGTLAEKIKDKEICKNIIKKRANELMSLHLEICKDIQSGYLNKKFKILIDKKGFENTWLGRTENYKLIAVQSKDKILGKIIEVSIKKISPHYLISEF